MRYFNTENSTRYSIDESGNVHSIYFFRGRGHRDLVGKVTLKSHNKTFIAHPKGGEERGFKSEQAAVRHIIQENEK